ncbi:hypothetical protein BO78DRAFT_422004 [Aspergillus sclerotiicarbonarius CBS 121057]|uniref:Uncharacterized protein n=1 Tax=Aspergillus sclerotiicarbonarius (strain CBS 121057 / IBT 28362) TaxID=1448318 RepID=A0A319EQA4_ASPSB|nr:hypothetical protein BO78DRAFT_422004 [Aspergillus sclerotiicarbonarius CBS 121057]
MSRNLIGPLASSVSSQAPSSDLTPAANVNGNNLSPWKDFSASIHGLNHRAYTCRPAYSRGTGNIKTWSQGPSSCVACRPSSSDIDVTCVNHVYDLPTDIFQSCVTSDTSNLNISPRHLGSRERNGPQIDAAVAVLAFAGAWLENFDLCVTLIMRTSVHVVFDY